MKKHLVPSVTLSNGVTMPQVGLGTWPLRGTDAARAVRSALDVGYRLIDTAEAYENEEAVGQGIRDAGVPRDEIFVTTKFNRQWHSVEGARLACEASLARLRVDYLDLLLIHWPNPDQNRYIDAFEGLVRLLERGVVRAIGTSNFKTSHLQRLFDAGFVPHVNQIQLDPWHPRTDVVAVHEEKRIVTEAWSPLGRAGEMLADPRIEAVARRHGRTPAQIVLRWLTQRGFVAAPKSADPGRQRSNIEIFDFALDDEELAAIGRLERADPAMLDADQFGH
ncbi:oxidoreductase [Burkholderia multivorans]|uniref:aldo/keto reductase n=1 Tax=Burkholderia multivorans TaxID=87883 RepID=UPI000CFF986E|nr:aldo/keto reductase [Burkholderia multivorans]MBU9366017.1 aldo/keto reductase [Burkholderia multivorans]PRG77643.1 oxidoreductase [Burkholderia multivorans]